MTILGIETSCDETALALIETRTEPASGSLRSDLGIRVIDSLVHSQAALHSAYGGVYPNLAKREHQKNLMPLLRKLMEPLYGVDFLESKPDIDRIAVTEGPGLEPALWTGIVFAQGLAEKWKIPVIPVNHMEGHIVGSLLPEDRVRGAWQKLYDLPTPAIALLISGGHTELVKIGNEDSVDNDSASPTGAPSIQAALATRPRSTLRHSPLRLHFKYTILGETKDDAVGEAFDKTARLLGLPYPGGPHIAMLAHEAREQKIESSVKLPRPMLKSGDLDFSFSGLKTAVLYAVRDHADANGKMDEKFRMGLAREFENAVSETLAAKLKAGIEKINARAIIIGGGVSANHVLRKRFQEIADEYGIPIFMPSRHISGDNALMIALAGAMQKPRNTSGPLRAHGTKRLE